jgi:hypothetical protein
MRDPRAPIPSPPARPDFWRRDAAPAAAANPSVAPARDFDPTRLLAPRGDLRGIDRREHVRGGPTASASTPAGRLVAASHRRLDAVVGLRTAQGFALVRTLSLAPTGVLVHLLDLLDPDLDPPLRRRGREVLALLAPSLGTPLATVGTCLLAPRVVADLAAWVAARREGTSTERGTPDASLRVGLVIPPRSRGPCPDPRRWVVVDGELSPLVDPDPRVLGVSLSPVRRRQLEVCLEPHIVPRRAPPGR